MSEGSKQSNQSDIWTEIANRAREAERRAFERRRELEFVSETNQRISELARTMWEADGKPPGQVLDYWLKAEEEVLGPWRQRMQEGAYGIWGKALGDWLQAQQAIFELMREMAESNWKAAGEPPGRLLEFLLEAAKQVSDSLKRQRMPNKK